MTGGEGTVGDEAGRFLGQIEQAEGVCHGAAGFADLGGDAFLREAEAVHELAVRGGLLERGEVLALEVFDEGVLGGGADQAVVDCEIVRVGRGDADKETGYSLLVRLAEKGEQAVRFLVGG